MKSSPLWEIAISTSLEAEEAATALLERLFGQPAASFSSPLRNRAVISLYSSKPNVLSKRAAIESGLQHLESSGLQTDEPEITIRKVRREDWAESWKKYFKPIEIGSALLIKASWTKRAARKGQRVVELDPGLSFGTGQHATTYFCLQQIVGRRKSGAQSLLDLGAGSGILSISAVKLGYKPVLALDNDPVAVRVAASNARKNRVTSHLTIRNRNIEKLPVGSRRKFDVICANLTDDLLIKCRRAIASRLARDGTLIIAGILASQFDQVRNAFEQERLHLVLTTVQDEWQSASFETRAKNS